MRLLVLSLLNGLASAVLELTTHTIDPKGDWTEVYRYAPNPKSHSLEIDLEMSVSRQTAFGKIVDLLSYIYPSSFEVKLTQDDSKIYEDKFNSSATVEVSAVVSLPSNGDVVMSVRNLNTYFPIMVDISGELIGSYEQFDLRSIFPSCPFPIYSQQLCGACYADVVAGAGTDALCLQNSGQAVVPRLSPQSILSCSGLGGCAGGSPYLATLWTQSHGLVEYNQSPFVSGTCDPNHDIQRDGCVECKDVWRNNIRSYHFRPVVLASDSEHSMRQWIEQNGPIMVIFDAHANFHEFFSLHPYGIYSKTSGSPSLGNHAVRLVGFGIDGDTKYWIAVNSWGPSWANRGSFKILRGVNLCKIEEYPVGIESTDLVAGASSDVGSMNHPLVGYFKDQDIHDRYWVEFVDMYKERIDNKLGSDSWTVSSIQTRISNGYIVKLKFKETEFIETKILIQLNSDGSVDVYKESRKKSRNPELDKNVLVN